MADLEKIVKIIFAGDSSDLSGTVNSVGKSMDSLALNVGKATQPLADLTDAVLTIDGYLAAFAAGALVVATTQAGAFGDSFKEISTLITDPAADLEAFKDDVLEYAKQSSFAFEQVTGATYDIISATGDWEGALTLLSDAEKLNIAGKGELNATTKLLVTSLNAYGKGVEDAGDFSDILFSTVKVGVTNLTELSGSLGNVTGLAASAGVPFSDLNTAIGALTGTVGDTSLAVTQIKGVLTAIVKPSAAAAEAAKELGIEFNTQALEAEGLEGFLKLVYDAADGNTEVMARLFGRVEALNGALVLGEDASGKYADALQTMEDRAGTVDAAWLKMADGFELQNQRIINSIKGTLVDVGTPLLDDWAKLAGGMVNIFSGISVGIDAGAFDPVIKFIEDIAGEISEQFDGIAEALPGALSEIDWSDFTESLQGLVDIGKDVFKELFGDLDLTNTNDLGDAIQIVVDLFARWIDLTGGIIDNLRPFIGIIGDLVVGFAEADKETVALVGSVAAWGKVINTVAGFMPNLTGPLTLLAAGFNLLTITRIPGLIKGFTGMLPSISGLVGPLGLAAKGLAAFGLGWTIGTVLKDHIPIVKDMGDKLGDAAFAILNLGDNAATAMEKQQLHTWELANAALALVDVKEAAENIPEDPIVITIDTELSGFFDDIDFEEWKLQNLTGFEIKVTADTTQAQEELEKVSDWNTIILEDGTEIRIPVTIDSSKTAESAAEAKAKIDEVLPAEKLMEIKLQGDIDIELQEIKSTAETLQAAFEWEAKIKVAGYEAAAKELEAIAGSVEAAWQSTGDVISSALGVLTADLDYFQWQDVIEIIDREQSLQESIWETQKLLVEAQIKLVEARTKALASGKGLITITADGVEPELEMVLQKIIKLAQIHANEEGFGMLLGI
jgi:TP901 family phage tail tape measure protein